MSTLRLLVVFILCTVRAATAGDFEAANDLFDQGKFLEARKTYEQLAARGERSANLFHNLANTDYRLGARGLAALNYERVLALEPDHPEAARNLSLVRDQTGARLPAPTWRDHIFPRTSAAFLAISGAVAAWLAIFCLARLMARGGAVSANIWLVMSLAILAAGYCGAALWHLERDGTLAIVVETKGATARLAPADRAGVAESLPAGSRIRVLSERGEWTYCALPGGGRGWLPAGSLEKIRLHPS